MDELVSVIMSTYNEPLEYIEMAIESILSQTWNKIEFIIVIDNPNNEELTEFIKKYERNNNITVIYNDVNRGLPYSLNEAIKKSKGNYIARMDADDISCKQRIEKQIEFLKKYNLDIVASNRIDIDENGDVIRESRKIVKMNKINKVLPYACIINHPSVLIKADVLKEAGGYREIESAEDYDLWLRLLTKKKKIGIIETPLIYYRIRHDSIGQKNNYLQRLKTEYVQLLFCERQHSGTDSYSKEHEAFFLKENGYGNIYKQMQYISSMNHMETGIKKCYQNNYAGLIDIVKSLRNKHIRIQLKGLLIVKWYTNYRRK